MLIPAIDIIQGECVRLSQGDYSRQTTYHTDPVEVAKRFEAAGMTRLHLVDLDGAKASKPLNLAVLERIHAATRLFIEYGGGIKSDEALKAGFAAGADRMVIGSIALSQPECLRQWLRQYGPDKIVLGADCRDGMIATRGWLEQSDMPVDDIIASFVADSLSHVIVTDIARDGMLQGPNIALYKRLCSTFPTLDIIASGGISSDHDIEQCRLVGCQDVIVGKAIYEGRISIC